MKIYKYIILFLLLSFNFSEKNSHEIQKEIDTTNKNLEEIKEEILNVENEIAKIKKEEKNNEKIIQTINKKITLIEKQIEQLLIQEKNINNLINVINSNIVSEENNLKNLKSQLEHRAKYLYKNGKPNLLSKITSAKDWNKGLTILKYLNVLIAHEKQIKKEINNSIKELKQERKQLNSEKKNKNATVENKNQEYKNLKNEKKKKNNYIKKIAQEKNRLKDILNSKKTMMSKIENSIKKLISNKKTAQKIEDDLAKKRAKKNKSTSGNFAKMKGKLNWPSSGIVISEFGMQTNPVLNTTIENLGIDIKTEKNAKIYPVLDGVISLITYNREYGNMVIVSHGAGYHTVYANIENIIVSENDYIDQNDRIGEVGKSNISNDYLLHFQIWKNENKLDPQDWLK